MPDTTKYPSYCCQRCGSQIGWLGRFMEAIFGQVHDCEEPNA